MERKIPPLWKGAARRVGNQQSPPFLLLGVDAPPQVSLAEGSGFHPEGYLFRNRCPLFPKRVLSCGSFEFAINFYKVPKDERDPWAVHFRPARRLLYTSMLLPEKLSLFLPSQTITGNSTPPVEGTILTARVNLRRPSLQMVLLCLTFAKYEVIRAYPRLGPLVLSPSASDTPR